MELSKSALIIVHGYDFIKNSSIGFVSFASI